MVVLRQLDILSPCGPSDPPIGRLSNARGLITRIERRPRQGFDPWRLAALHGPASLVYFAHQNETERVPKPVYISELVAASVGWKPGGLLSPTINIGARLLAYGPGSLLPWGGNPVAY